MSTNSQDWGSKLPQAQRDSIQKLVDSGRILPIEEGGVTSPIWDYMKRPMAMVRYGDTYVPHYISSGLGGKKTVATGMWYPIAGIGIDSDWLNKGSSSQINNYYGDTTLQKLANILDVEIGNVDHSLLPRVPYDSMSFPRRVNDLIGVGPGLENWSGGDVNDPLTATSNRVARRFSNIAYKARGYDNLPYPDIRERDTSADFKAEYASKTGGVVTPTVQPVSTTQPIIDTPVNMIGQSSEWVPSRFSNGKTPHETKTLMDVYEKQGGRFATDVLNTVFNKNPITPVIKPAAIRKQLGIPATAVSHPAVSSVATSGVDTSKSAKQVHINTHNNLSNNSVKNFFKGGNLTSFDTETTNLDVRSPDFAKRGRIWQIGLAKEGIDGVEHHVNPFFIKRKDGSLEQSSGVRDFILKDQLRNSNGLFSQKMYDQGNFKGFMEDYQKGNLVNLDKSLMSTLGTLNSKDVVVLQNMNFENNVLKSSLEQGILKPETYRTIADRMQTVSVDVIGKTNFLFERPREVQHQMRQADLTFRSQFLKDSSEESWKRYTGHLDSAIGAYETAISDPSRRGAIAVELQDITKSFLAEAADSGYIEKTNATLGLNMEFLVKNILGDSEKHTALSDAQQTIELHNSMLSMRSELKNGNVSDNTKQILSRIKEDQPTEVNRQFVKSVKSVLSDFKIQKHTKIGSANSWHTPFVQLKSKANSGYRLDEALHRQSSGPSKYTEGSLSGALSNVLDRYKDHPDSINDFSRAGYIEHLLGLNKQGSNFTELHSLVEKDSLNGAKTQGNYVPKSSGTEKEFTEVLGKKVQKKTVKTAVAGIGLGLAYAAFQDNPHPVVKDNENVSQQFYDDQYLGSAFVDFRERNKHYMM